MHNGFDTGFDTALPTQPTTSATQPKGFTYNGFFVFDPRKDIGSEEGVYNPDSGMNIPIKVDIPMSSLPPNDRFPSIYIKPVDGETLSKKGFDVGRIVGDLVIELKIRDEAGNMITQFDDSIFISLPINPTLSSLPNVLLLADSTDVKAFRPVPTQLRNDLSPPALIGKIKRLTADSNPPTEFSAYVAPGINHAPTIAPLGTASVEGKAAKIALRQNPTEDKSMNVASDVKVTLTGTDFDDDPLTFIITQLPANGYLCDGVAPIFAAPFAIKSNTLTYTPRTGYFGTD